MFELIKTFNYMGIIFDSLNKILKKISNEWLLRL